MPGRTGVEVALARHVAADRDERRGPERELLGAEQRGDEQVAAGLEAAVGAQRDAVAEVVAEQDLVDLGQAELPRRPDVLDRRQRRRPGPAGVTGQVDVRRAGLGDPGRDRAHTSARDELDADARPRVDRPQVGDELGEVLDRVDVVVRRRADVALAGLAAAERGDVGGRLLAGQLAALARLRALGDLDLELVGAGEVGGGHAEPGRGDLLDPGVVAAAVGGRGVPGRVLAALAGVRRAAGALDADGQRLVGLRAQRADAHRGHDEAADDVAGGLDLARAGRASRRRGRAARRAGRSGPSPDGRARRDSGRGRRRCRARRRSRHLARRGRTGPGSRRRCAARRDASRRRRGTGRTRGPAGAARGRRPAPGWRARRRGGGSGGRRGRPASCARATRRRSGSSARRPTDRDRRRRPASRRCTTRRR